MIGKRLRRPTVPWKLPAVTLPTPPLNSHPALVPGSLHSTRDREDRPETPTGPLAAWGEATTSLHRLRKRPRNTTRTASLFSRPTATGQPAQRTNRHLGVTFTQFCSRMTSAAPRRLPTTSLCRNTTTGLPRIKCPGDNPFTLYTPHLSSHTPVTENNGTSLYKMHLRKMRLRKTRLPRTKISNASH